MEKARSLEEIYRQAAKFAYSWNDIPGDERQESQGFVRDLLAVYGIIETRAASFEKRARRSSTGHQGFIDALVPGQLAIEMKSEGKNLVEAEQQALDYLNDLSDAEFPNYVLTSDFKSFRLLNLRDGSDHEAVTWTLSEFRDYADQLAFLAGYGERAVSWEEREAASIKAAQLMGSLYEGLAKEAHDEHQISVFLVRILFCLYADDAALWGERDLFLEFVEHRTEADGNDLGPQLNQLFQVLRTPESQRPRSMQGLLARFPYVNGGLFEERVDNPWFDAEMRGRIIEACYFNWSAISPAIFGSLFQAVKDKNARRSLGAHYTTERNILRVIRPMFLDELETEFTGRMHSAQGLRRMRERLGQMHFFDPACGCGNFLIVAYREMRDLELRILERIQKLDAERGRKSASREDAGLFFTGDQVMVKISHFHGIEIEDWPARIAATALHLVEHQANQEMESRLGQAPGLLPLDKVETIHVGNALRTDWSDLVSPSEDVTVFGNPPFLGHATRSSDQAEELRAVWRRDDIGRLDYVTGWYKKSLDYFAHVDGGRWGFVSTNSITQGEPVPALFRPVFDAGWRIRFAHRTFAWTSEAPGSANVHCTIVGFDRRKTPVSRLYSYSSVRAEPEVEDVARINGYLVAAPNVLVKQRRQQLAPDLGNATFGNMARDGGNLLVSPKERDALAYDTVVTKYLHRFVGAKELVRSEDRWCLWLEDLDPADVARSPELKRRLEAVREFRAASAAASTRQMSQTPHLFGQRSQPDIDYVCIPRHVSESRRYFTVELFDPETICGDANFKIPDPDGFQFAILSSSMFITWQKTIGGRLKSDIRFSNTLVWNNVPLPRVPEELRSEIVAAGKTILEARERHPGRSLADHYNPLVMDPVLIKAHDKLDALVDRAFGAGGACGSEKQRQEILFTRYAEMTEEVE